MRVLLVEPWLGGSHRAWAHGYARHSRHEVVVVGHEGRFWRWRLRGGALTLADAAADAVVTHGPFDVVLASSYLHLPAFLGFTRRTLGPVPVVQYRHESQLVYPAPAGREADPSLALIDWLGMAVADEVWCNSHHHLDALAVALPGFLTSMPDHDHAHRLEGVLARTRVEPVGVELVDLLAASRQDRAGQAPLVLWNHRWDPDKAPERFFHLLGVLADEGVDFRLAVAGANQRREPREFMEARARLADRVEHFGPLDRAGYEALLARADVVFSTARHECFGVAVVEAVAAGAVPLLPNRLAYPELIGDRWQDAVLYRAPETRDRLRALLEDLPGGRAAVVGLRESMARFDWHQVAPRYDEGLARVAAG